MEIKGYKGFNGNRTNRYGMEFVEGKVYSILNSDNISFGNNGNGYHMCSELCDVFRYFDSRDIVVASVIGSGEYAMYNDEYYGYYHMYSVRKLYIKKFLSREDIINEMLNEINPLSVIKFLSTFILSDNEIMLFKNKFKNSISIINALNYYQIQELQNMQEGNLVLKKVKDNG